MIEKGIILEPVPLALLVVVLASVSVKDYTAWLVLCFSGCVASIIVLVRRWLRMAALGKLLNTLSKECNDFNDSFSVRVDIGHDGDSVSQGWEASEAAQRAKGEVTMQLDARSPKSASSPSVPLPVVPIGATRIRVLTYNLYLRPPLINSNGNDWKDERLDLFIARVLPQYDVIALQEVFALGSSRQRRLVHAARQLGFQWVVSSKAPPFLTSLKFIDAGLLILSRYPIVEAAGHIYKTGHQIDHYAAKQVIYARISIPGANGAAHDVNVFTTHTQASYYENAAHLNAQNDAARLSQVQELISFVDAKVFSRPDNASNPVLILGDLNLDARASPSDGRNKGHEYVYLEDIFRKRFGTTPLQHLQHLTNYKEKRTMPPCGCVGSGVSLRNSGQIQKDHVCIKTPWGSTEDLLATLSTQESTGTCKNPTCEHVLSVKSNTEAKEGAEPESVISNETASDSEPCFCVRDLILESYDGDHPPTYGDAEVDEHGEVSHIQEPVLTNAADWACRLAIDFIFLISRSQRSTSSSSSESKTSTRSPSVRPVTTRIQKFLVNPLLHPFFQLSDHYAVDTILDIM